MKVVTQFVLTILTCKNEKRGVESPFQKSEMLTRIIIYIQRHIQKIVQLFQQKISIKKDSQRKRTYVQLKKIVKKTYLTILVHYKKEELGQLYP